MNKRLQRNRLGAPRPPDDRKVRTPADATKFWTELARAELATGYSLRTDPASDLAAFPLVLDECRRHARALGERTLLPVLVAGAEPVAQQLDEIVSMLNADEELTAEANPAELVVAAAAKFAVARRKAIARVARGEKSRALRHAFGISRPMKSTSVEEVREALVALLAGREDFPTSQAARLLTVADAKKAKGYVVTLNEIRTRNGARRQSSAETARTRDVLHAALELFYDRYGAAAELAFEDDDATRVALLSLIPRRKEGRRPAAKPPAPAAKSA